MMNFCTCRTTARVVSGILCIYCLLTASAVFAQGIEGSVSDQTGAPLPGVHVVIEGSDRGTITNNQGEFSLSDLEAGRYTILFSYVGFQSKTIPVEIEGQDIVLNVSLAAEVLEADEVLVLDDRADVLTIDSRSVSVLNPEDLVELRGQTLGETLESLPGVTALQTGPSISKPIVRGLHSQRVLVLNAGVSQEGQQWGGEHAPEIDPFAPISIQVIKGVAGVEYGIGAIGGVIKLDPLELPYVPGQGGCRTAFAERLFQ